MAQLDMAMILGGRVLPYPKDFRRIISPNETDVRTLGGGIYTDFINFNRGWRVSWENLKAEDFQIIYDLWEDQYTTHTYKMLQFDAYGIYAPVKINISEEQAIKYNGSIIQNFSITLIEQFAVS